MKVTHCVHCIVECDCGHYYAATVALAVLFCIAVVIIIVLLVLGCKQRDKNRSYKMFDDLVCFIWCICVTCVLLFVLCLL